MVVSEAPAPLNAGFRYVSTFTDSESLREELREEAVIGYASEGELDIRAGGSGLAGYYLAQFAVAPVLLDPHSASQDDADKYDLVLAIFETPGQLSAYLIEHSRQALVSLSGNIALTHRRKR
jgi:hypothetical protein